MLIVPSSRGEGAEAEALELPCALDGHFAMSAIADSNETADIQKPTLSALLR
jgi:hypothetical protein